MMSPDDDFAHAALNHRLHVRDDGAHFRERRLMTHSREFAKSDLARRAKTPHRPDVGFALRRRVRLAYFSSDLDDRLRMRPENLPFTRNFLRCQVRGEEKNHPPFRRKCGEDRRLLTPEKDGLPESLRKLFKSARGEDAIEFPGTSPSLWLKMRDESLEFVQAVKKRRPCQEENAFRAREETRFPRVAIDRSRAIARWVLQVVGLVGDQEIPRLGP